MYVCIYIYIYIRVKRDGNIHICIESMHIYIVYKLLHPILTAVALLARQVEGGKKYGDQP